MSNIIDKIFESLLGAGSTWDLIILAIKIVVLLFIISFVRERFGNSWFATLVTFALAYVVLFQVWVIFGPMMLVYMFVIFGFSGFLMDLTITKPWQADAYESARHGREQAKMRL